MSKFVDIVDRYTNRLDALLLERGFNLLWYQQQSGIFLKEHRLITDVEFYLGSIKMAQKYIDEALPKLGQEQPQEPNNGGVGTSKETFLKGLNEIQKQHFEDAIEKKMMEETDNGYNWLYGGKRGKVRLSFFLQNVFNPDGCSAMPGKELETLFGVKKLAQSASQRLSNKKHLKWEDEILKLFKHP